MSPTPGQEYVLNYLIRYHRENGFSPKVREIADAIHLSQSTTWIHLKALEDKGLVRQCGLRGGFFPTALAHPLLRETLQAIRTKLVDIPNTAELLKQIEVALA